MKIRFFLIFVFLCTILSISCGRQQNLLDYSLDFRSLDYVNLYRYHGKFVPEYPVYTRENLDSIILFHLSFNDMNKPLSCDRVPHEEDIAVIDLSANVTGEEIFHFSEYRYTIGSLDFGDEFDAVLLSMQQNGEEKLVTIDYPPDFPIVDFAGNTVTFHIALFGLEVPVESKDTEWILHYYECNSMDQVYEKVEREAIAKSTFEQLFELVYEKSRIRDYPPHFKSLLTEASVDGTTSADVQLFNEILLLKAICEYENMEMQKEEYERRMSELISKYPISYTQKNLSFEPPEYIWQILHDYSVQMISTVYSPE